MSLLSYLRVASHVSDDARYEEAARELIEVHDYAANIMVPKVHSGPGTGNQSDDDRPVDRTVDRRSNPTDLEQNVPAVLAEDVRKRKL